jgi:hypothetical protein
MASLSSKYPLVSDPRSKPALADMKTKMLRIADAEDDFERSARSAGIQRVRTFTELDLPNIELEHSIFAGRADRVDFLSSPHGTFAVISDYKSKGASRYRESLQLAAYAAALRNSDVAAGGVRYLCHGDGTAISYWSQAAKQALGQPRAPSCEEKIELALEKLLAADQIAADGRYEANYDSPSCAWCGHSAICRRSERRGASSLDEGDLE